MDLIRRDIIEKLGLKMVEVKIPQHIVGYFREETLEQLQIKSCLYLLI